MMYFSLRQLAAVCLIGAIGCALAGGAQAGDTPSRAFDNSLITPGSVTKVGSSAGSLTMSGLQVSGNLEFDIGSVTKSSTLTVNDGIGNQFTGTTTISGVNVVNPITRFFLPPRSANPGPASATFLPLRSRSSSGTGFMGPLPAHSSSSTSSAGGTLILQGGTSGGSITDGSNVKINVTVPSGTGTLQLTGSGVGSGVTINNGVLTLGNSGALFGTGINLGDSTLINSPSSTVSPGTGGVGTLTVRGISDVTDLTGLVFDDSPRPDPPPLVMTLGNVSTAGFTLIAPGTFQLGSYPTYLGAPIILTSQDGLLSGEAAGFQTASLVAAADLGFDLPSGGLVTNLPEPSGLLLACVAAAAAPLCLRRLRRV